MLLSLIHPVSSLSAKLETTHPDHTAPAELSRTQHGAAVTQLSYWDDGGWESVCVFKKAACRLPLQSLQLAGVLCGLQKKLRVSGAC